MSYLRRRKQVTAFRQPSKNARRRAIFEMLECRRMLAFDATFSPQQVVNPTFTTYQSAFTSDLDSDGDIDILSASWSSDEIAWYENDGHENFAKRVVTTTADGAFSVSATDLDLDGDVDILFTSEFDNKVGWFENDGNENFTERLVVTTAVRPRSIAASDVDGDGDLDLLSASVINDRIAWYQNDGQQSFVEFGIDSMAEFATWVEATDLDRDGDMDVLAAASSPSQVVWYENNGSEAFTKRFIGGSFGESSAQVVTPTDFDNDGDIDVVAGFYNHGISWFENSGTQTFTRHVVTTTAGLTGLRSVAVADFDGDGDKDVAAATEATNRLDWYENDGDDLSFTRHILVNEGISYRSVHAGDVDRDGDTDLVTASRTIGWFENEQLAIQGTKFEDTNGDGDRDVGEPPLPGVTVFVDLNDNGQLDELEPRDTTDANGDYALTNLGAGDYVVREVVPDGYEQTFPQAAAPRLFAIDPNVASPTRIVEVDPVSGATLNSFSAPGTVAGVTAGLAFDGQTIYFIDSSTDTLYELNPDTGAILDSMTLSSTPRWDGIAVLNGLVYINDPSTRVIVVIDPTTDTIVTTINVPPSNFVPFGALGELPDDSGGQLVAPIGLSSGVVLLDRVTGAANSSFGHAFVSNGDNFGVTSIDGEIYLGFDDPAGTVLVYTPSGTLLRSFQVGFGMTGLGAASSGDAAHRVTALPGQSLTGLDFGNHRLVGSIAGTKYEDLDGDGRQDAGEGPLPGVTIYLDFNDNGAHDNNEPATVTDSNGDFLFSDVPVGSYVVREVLSEVYSQTAPGTRDAFFYAGKAVTDELITIDATTGQVAVIGPFGADIVGLARTRSGELFALRATSTDSFYSVNTATGAATLIGPTGGDVVFGLAYDDITDTIYTLRNLGTTRRLATIDRTTGTTTIIGTGSGLVSNVSGLAFDSATNRVIAFDNGEDEFWAFDVTTGVPTLLAVASPGVETFGFTQAGTNFVMPGSFTSLSYVDPTTGAFTPYLTLSQGVGIDGLEYIPASDGSHRVTVLANTIRDRVDFGNQRRTLTVSIADSTITENGGLTTGTVSRSGDTTGSPAIVVSLTSNDESEATVPTTVTIPAGQSSATFAIDAVDDAVADGTQIVTITAISGDFISGAATVDITDDETAGIVVSAISGNTTEAGGTATFTVVLTSEPTGDVAIGIFSSDTSEGTVSTSSLIFTAANWNMPQTVTVTGADDAVDDGDIAYSISTAAASSSDATYDGLNAADVAVTNVDDDTAGIVVSAISGNTNEAGASATFTVVLTSEPTADVTIGISSSDTTEGTVSTTSLLFTAANWNTAQTVTVTGADDAVDDGDVAYSILTAAASSSDAGYNGLNAADVAVINLDDDTAGIAVSAISGNTTEDGASATFTVVLTSEPTADVTIGISSSDTTEGTVSTTSLFFTAANWNTAQTVTVTGADDAVDDGDIAYSIATAAASSTDATYNGLNAADVAVTNLDDDTAGIVVSAISGNTTEAGGSATFTVVLTSEPTADVAIGISSSDTIEGTASTTSLLFTAANWNTAQTMTVTGADDAVDDGDIAYSIVTAAASSGDTTYNGLNAADVAVTNVDDDTAGIVVSAISGNTTEGGANATFTVVLTSEPTAAVTIGISSSDTTEGTVSTTSLFFTETNWSILQTVTVTGADDAVDDGDIAYSILTAAASSSDANYNGLNAADVAVTNVDDDTAGIVVSAISGNTTEAGGSATFTVVLTSEPTAAVTIGISSSDTTEGTVSTSSLVFTAANWNTAQTVTVTGADDVVDDGDIAYSILTTAASSSDATYNGLNAADVAVTNVDDDTAGIVVSAISGDTSEPGASATFTVVLTSEPTADVTIGISSSDTTEGTVSTSSLVFTAANWNTVQTVTVTGVDDLLVDGDIAYTIVLSAAVSSDSLYNGLDLGDLSVTNLDNDVPQLLSYFPLSGVLVAGGTSYSAGRGPVAESFSASDLRMVDGIAQSIQEGESLVGSGKKPKLSSALDYYQWSFGVVTNATSFSLDAWRTTNPEGDNFRFEYSLDGGAWLTLATVNSAIQQSYDIDLSASPLSGDLVVRVVDTDRSPVQPQRTPILDTIHVDAISFDTLIFDLRPRVNVMATDASAAESPLDNGQFTLSREETTGDLQVFYSVSGSATAGMDYATLTGTATIPDGQTSTTITVAPIDDSDSEGDETVIVTLSQDDSYAYKIGASDSATAIITDDDLRLFNTTSENTVSGSITAGNYTATSDADAVVETITEQHSGGKPANRTSFMDHRWTFASVTGAKSFYLTASRPNNSEGDDFAFQYSTNGGASWTHLATVATSALTLYPVALPSAISGNILVRVIDTNPNTAGNGALDRVNIDEMYFSTAPVAPLVVDGTTSVAGGQPLTRTELDTAAQRVLEFWQQFEPHSRFSTLKPITFEIVQLANPYLGLAYPAQNRIQIDVDAAGFGWNQVDLFATLVHETGHLYGHDHDELGGSLSIGARLEPTGTVSLALWRSNNGNERTRPSQQELRGLGNDRETSEGERFDTLQQSRHPAPDDRAVIRSQRARGKASEAALIDELFARMPDVQADDDLLHLLAESRSTPPSSRQ